MSRGGAFLAGLAVAGVAAMGCAGVKPPSPAPAAGGRQSLFRVQFEGTESKGSFRLLLRRASDERFDLAASDPLGRTLWALEVVAGEGTWFDFRARRVCALGRRFRLEALQLPDLPLAAVPRILAGEAPHAPGVDQDGRTWTLHSGAGGLLAAWELTGPDLETLRYVLEPAANGAATLSNRTSTLRFRRVADEPLAKPLTPREPGADFLRGGCEAVALS